MQASNLIRLVPLADVREQTTVAGARRNLPLFPKRGSTALGRSRLSDADIA